MRLGRIIGWIVTVFAGTVASREEAKTFPGASILLPAVLPIIGTIIPSLIPGSGGPPGVSGELPGVSISHSTSIATSVHNRPIAVSHSGSVSTTGNTDAGSAASAGSVSAQSSSGTSRKASSFKAPLLSKPWRKFFKQLG